MATSRTPAGHPSRSDSRRSSSTSMARSNGGPWNYHDRATGRRGPAVLLEFPVPAPGCAGSRPPGPRRPAARSHSAVRCPEIARDQRCLAGAKQGGSGPHVPSRAGCAGYQDFRSESGLDHELERVARRDRQSSPTETGGPKYPGGNYGYDFLEALSEGHSRHETAMADVASCRADPCVGIRRRSVPGRLHGREIAAMDSEQRRPRTRHLSRAKWSLRPGISRSSQRSAPRNCDHRGFAGLFCPGRRPHPAAGGGALHRIHFVVLHG